MRETGRSQLLRLLRSNEASRSEVIVLRLLGAAVQIERRAAFEKIVRVSTYGHS